VAISIGGIVSGIDTDSMVASLVAAARAPQDVMKSKLEEVEDQRDTYEQLRTYMDDMLTALEAIDTPAELRAATGTSSDESAVTVEVDGDAVIGRYSVEVSQLASSATYVSNGFADKSTAGTIAEGTFTITYGTTTTTLTVDSSNSSLSDLADLINESVSGVTAYIMDTGDATSPYRLVLAGNDTGAENTVTLDLSGLTGAGTVPTFTETSAAQDALLTVNGVSITSADNTIEDVISGVTFTLEDITTSATTINVKADTDTTVANIKAFVEAYNTVRGYINTHRAYDSEAGIKGEFVGESTVVSLMQALQTALGSEYASGVSYNSLASIGFETQQNGKLELDEDTLKAALEAASDDVAALFQTDAAGFGDQLKELIDLYASDDEVSLDDTGAIIQTGGLLTNRMAALDDEIELLNDDIDAFDERMDAYEERLKKQFLAMEVALGKLQSAQSQLEALLPDSSSSSSDSS
jgi:flagellar hook-associated protein 2